MTEAEAGAKLEEITGKGTGSEISREQVYIHIHTYIRIPAVDS